MKEIILASGSPRRKELMEMLGFDFRVIVSDVEEVVDESLKPEEIVKSLAHQKALAVFNEHQDALVIGSDTIVVADDKILGKPHSKLQAKEMMELLKNDKHQVMTAVSFISDKEEKVICDKATVHFNDIELTEIEKYIETKEPYDKAGGYAIQGWAGKHIRAIEGNFYTIMGLPVDIVYQYLKDYE